MDDPILQASTAIALVLIPILSVGLSKIKLKLIFLIPVVALIISFPLFLLLVIAQDIPYGKYLFYVSMSLWTGGFFGIFISWILYIKKRKNLR
jgi:hypothetical protein